MTTREKKLQIINNPNAKIELLALLCETDSWRVSELMGELNIKRSERPEECKG